MVVVSDDVLLAGEVMQDKLYASLAGQAGRTYTYTQKHSECGGPRVWPYRAANLSTYGGEITPRAHRDEGHHLKGRVVVVVSDEAL